MQLLPTHGTLHPVIANLWALFKKLMVYNKNLTAYLGVLPDSQQQAWQVHT